MDNSKNEGEERGVREDNSEGMKTKEAIKCIKIIKKNYIREDGGICLNESMLFEEIIGLLKRGEENEKYKMMWEELLDELIKEGDEYTRTNYIAATMKKYKQKYFPKEK